MDWLRGQDKQDLFVCHEDDLPNTSHQVHLSSELVNELTQSCLDPAISLIFPQPINFSLG
jgi:hypothetical protein